MPIRVTADWVEEEDDDTDQTITNVGLGGLAFQSSRAFDLMERVRVTIPVLERDNQLTGNVVWCEKVADGYEIGIEFEKSRDTYRMRMIEQICHIEHYRNEVERLEGRKISSQEAADEWIARFARDFPEL
jgi:Tfp pilus assembly protein PilZ